MKNQTAPATIEDLTLSTPSWRNRGGDRDLGVRRCRRPRRHARTSWRLRNPAGWPYRRATPTVGQVTPVRLDPNGTDTPRAVVPGQVFASLTPANNHAPLPPGAAARQAGRQGAGRSDQSAAVQRHRRRRRGRSTGAVTGTTGSAGGWGFRSPGAGALVGQCVIPAVVGHYPRRPEKGQIEEPTSGQSADQGGLRSNARECARTHRARLGFLPPGTIQPDRDAAGRSRDRPHRSRPRTLALTG